MKKWEKEILQNQIQDESMVTIQIENAYKEALDEINDKIQVLMSKEQTQSVIYQLKYQQALQKQVESVYSKMASTWYKDIDSYLNACYEDSFYSTMYGLHQEGIPTIIPFNQKDVAQAAAQDIGAYAGKLSEKIYDNVYHTATETIRKISKGLSMNSSYATIALDIAKTGSATVNQALRIVRTEGHRIHEEVKFKTINKVKEETGADIVKQWDSSIDRRTRKSHAALDGQLRELDQPFKSPTSGHTAMYPGGFGIASEDINCRCVVLQRARWALDKSELDKYVGDLDGMTEDQLEELAGKLGVSKDELIKASNGIINADGSINHTIKAQNYNQFKKKYQKKAKVVQAQQDAQDELQKIADLQNAIDDAQNKLNALPNKTYSGIWKDDVSLSDYEFKKNTIQSKKDYYLQKLANGGLTDADKAKYLKYLDDLDEFETEGAKYLKAKNDLQDLKNQLKAASGATSSRGVFSADAYGQRKADALKRRFKIGDNATADKYYRPQLDKQWRNVTDDGKYATWEYTHNSNPINKPISGYANGNWDRRDFRGVGNVDWGTEDSWRSIPSQFARFGNNGHVDYHRTIKNLTKAIEETDFADDVILHRGQGYDGFAGLLENSNLSYDEAYRMLVNNDIAGLKAKIEGRVYQNHAFTSTAMTKVPKAFQKKIYIEVYAPKGTKALYSEPQSYYGRTATNSLYKVGQAYSGVGDESEIILQRGTKFRITSIEIQSSPYSEYSNTYTVKMEVVDQPDYFKFGDEETFNDGATRHKS